MSGKPNSTEITALLMNFQKLNRLRDSIGQRNAVIARETEAVEHECLEVDELWKKSKALIEGMDVHTEGNYGFEKRYLWFILELSRQAETFGRTHP